MSVIDDLLDEFPWVQEPRCFIITAKLLGETEKAYFIEYKKKDYWLPKSRVLVNRFNGDKIELEVPEWLCVANKITSSRYSI